MTTRFIPARAGNTRPIWSACCHPAGSSPRERGTHQAILADRRRRRFIPARAGNTSRVSACGRKAAVHPRASGEHTSSNLLIHQ